MHEVLTWAERTNTIAVLDIMPRYLNLGACRNAGNAASAQLSTAHPRHEVLLRNLKHGEKSQIQRSQIWNGLDVQRPPEMLLSLGIHIYDDLCDEARSVKTEIAKTGPCTRTDPMI